MFGAQGTYRLKREHSCEVGAYVQLTNRYCLVGDGLPDQHFFLSVKDAILNENYTNTGLLGGGDTKSVAMTSLADDTEMVPTPTVMPLTPTTSNANDGLNQAATCAAAPADFAVIDCTVGGLPLVGRLTVGNSHGLLVPNTTSDDEFEKIKSQLPEGVGIRKVPERHNALGNVVVCNDSTALLHPDLDEETEAAVYEVLKIDPDHTFRTSIADNFLVGSYCAMTNRGVLVHPHTPMAQLSELSSLLELPVAAGSVNRGQILIGAGVAVNDRVALVGLDTTGTESEVIESVMGLRGLGTEMLLNTLAGQGVTAVDADAQKWGLFDGQVAA